MSGREHTSWRRTGPNMIKASGTTGATSDDAGGRLDVLVLDGPVSPSA
jgi:hypothetical protein